jgi:hypothetical protein
MNDSWLEITLLDGNSSKRWLSLKVDNRVALKPRGLSYINF